jgi:tetratricopeptide (TPR) repeat protein
MKYCRYSINLMAAILLLTAASQAYAQLGLNRIEGRVTDETNNGVYNAYVELYDNTGSTVARQRTSGQGRFSFRGMGPGRYTIMVKPYGTNLAADEREIEIDNSASHSAMVMADFRLRQDKRFQHNDVSIVGTVFAQEVPAQAKHLYASGIDAVRSNPEKGIADLQKAVTLFPTYFDALAALGKAQIVRGKYAEGYPFLLKALDVNRRCSDCYYSLSLAFYKLNEINAAVKAVDAAAVLEPKNPSVRLLQGIIYRLNNNLPGAEKALLLAKSLFATPNAEVQWQLSLVYNRLKRNQEAAAQLDEYLKTKTDMSAAEKESVRNLIAKLRKTT